jgi:hypothetical protein
MLECGCDASVGNAQEASLHAYVHVPARRHVASNAIPGQKQRYVLCTQADKEALRDLQITNDGLQERLAQLGDFAYIPCVSCHAASHE